MRIIWQILLLASLFSLTYQVLVVKPATFDSHYGLESLQISKKFSLECEKEIHASFLVDNFEFLKLQLLCDKKLLMATLIYAIGAIDPEGSYIQVEKRIELANGILETYLPIFEVPYHNQLHASDLIQRYVVFMEKKNIDNIPLREYLGLTDLEYLAGVIAAAGHDSGHPGDNNAMEREIQTYIGQYYNGMLELLSCDLTIALLLGPKKYNYRKYFFNILFKPRSLIKYRMKGNKNSYLKIVSELKENPDQVYARRALFARNKLARLTKTSPLTKDFLASNKDLKHFLNIVREAIYLTNMNPFHSRFDAILKSKVKKDVNGVSQPFDLTLDENKNKFSYAKFATLMKEAIVYGRDYFETGTNLDDADFPAFKTSYVFVEGMRNLESKLPEDEETLKNYAKYFVIGEIIHSSDIGNSNYDFDIYNDWYKLLMYEWAFLNCKKPNPLYNPNQAGFLNFVVKPYASELKSLFVGFKWEEVEQNIAKNANSIDKNNAKSDPATWNPEDKIIKSFMNVDLWYELDKKKALVNCPFVFQTLVQYDDAERRD